MLDIATELPPVTDASPSQVPYLTEAQASTFTGIPVATLRSWRSRGKGPPFLKIEGTLVRYEREALTSYLNRQGTH